VLEVSGRTIAAMLWAFTGTKELQDSPYTQYAGCRSERFRRFRPPCSVLRGRFFRAFGSDHRPNPEKCLKMSKILDTHSSMPIVRLQLRQLSRIGVVS
jgi:hypothetical protein